MSESARDTTDSTQPGKQHAGHPISNHHLAETAAARPSSSAALSGPIFGSGIADLRALTPADMLVLQRTVGNQAVNRLLSGAIQSSTTAPRLVTGLIERASAPAGIIQRSQHHPGDRITFTGRDGAQYSGLVAKVRTDSPTESSVVYEVDATKDGVQRSYVVSNGVATAVDMPAAPDVPKDIDQIMEMDVVTVTKEMVEAARKEKMPFKAEVGDILVGSGIIIKKPKEMPRDTDVEKAHKAAFQQGVVRDLWIISRTESGKGLLASINSAAQKSALRDKRTGGIVTFIDFTNRSNAGERDPDEAAWNPATNQPGEGSTASVGYNAQMAGLPLAEGAHASDAEIAPALEAGWGRPKEKPSDVTLFHEMVHADDIMHGRLYTQEVASGQFDASKVSEMHAVGLEEYRDTEFLAGRTETPAIYSENTYRRERGVASRPWYKDPKETQAPPTTRPVYTGTEAPVPVPQPFSGWEKAFSFQKTIDAREAAIRDAQKQNAQIGIAKSRSLLVQEVEANNKQAFESMKVLTIV